MMQYTAPIEEMAFLIRSITGKNGFESLDGFEEINADVIKAILEESAKFTEKEIAPLNKTADANPSYWKDGAPYAEVFTSEGFKEGYEQFVKAGWQGLHHPVAYGGQGLPKILATACSEMLQSANLSFGLCPLLTDGAIEALQTAGSEEQKRLYLPKLIAGEWTGTMNLTEPQAGSDLSLVRTRAERQADGTYLIRGQKIFITYGEHDMAENIIHLVLARTSDAPEGIKGISLFLVPKFLPDENSGIGERNDVQCVSLEHKLGIKASPTACLQFGEKKGAVGYLVGEENRGIEYMFIMMNAARFAVGIQGVGISERACQQAILYAAERIQSRPADGSSSTPVAIIRHPDVKRSLLAMRSLIDAMRALAYFTAWQFDVSQHASDEYAKAESKAIYEFLVPIVKGWSTENAVRIASMGVQVHGGMGFIEETGAAQYYRDARILPIYEGTTAIQANDLVGRKTARDSGAIARKLLKMVDSTLLRLSDQTDAAPRNFEWHLRKSRYEMESAINYVVLKYEKNINAVLIGSSAYLDVCGIVLAGWRLGELLLSLKAETEMSAEFKALKYATALFFAEQILPQTASLSDAILFGAESVTSVPEELLTHGLVQR